jgi:hypothetical protein
MKYAYGNILNGGDRAPVYYTYILYLCLHLLQMSRTKYTSLLLPALESHLVVRDDI